MGINYVQIVVLAVQPSLLISHGSHFVFMCTGGVCQRGVSGAYSVEAREASWWAGVGGGGGGGGDAGVLSKRTPKTEPGIGICN